MGKVTSTYMSVIQVGFFFTAICSSFVCGGPWLIGSQWSIPRFSRLMSFCLVFDYFGPLHAVDGLHNAACNGNIAHIDSLLYSGEDIDCQSFHNKMTPLMVAISKYKPLVARHLIQQGASISLVDSSQRTALHHAVISGDEQLVKLLLQQNANVNVVDQKGYTPLRLAVIHHKLPVLCALISADILEGSAQTALTVAVARRDHPIVKELLRRGVHFEVSPSVSDSEYELQDIYHKERFKSIEAFLYEYDLPDVLIDLVCVMGNVKRYD